MTSFIEIGSLYLARITPLFLMPNLLPIAKLPGSVKIILSLSIALILAVAIEPPYTYQALKWEQFVVAIMQELVIGMGLVFGIQITLSSILFAGKIIDLQLGFGVASVLDPMTQTQEALIGTLLNSLFTVSFFILDIHHLLIKGIATTFEHFPIGSGIIIASPSHLISFFSSQFILGILIVMPVILGLFLLDTVIAFTSKTMPQVNVYFVSLPLKIFVGLFVLSVSLKYMAGYIGNSLSLSIEYWFTGLEVF